MCISLSEAWFENLAFLPGMKGPLQKPESDSADFAKRTKGAPIFVATSTPQTTCSRRGIVV